MQRVATFFLIYILIAFPMLSIATPVISTFDSGQICTKKNAIMADSNKAGSHDCCQLQSENHCATGQCDCDTGHSSHSLLNTDSTPFFNKKSPTLKPVLFSSFISHLFASLYRPPRISC